MRLIEVNAIPDFAVAAVFLSVPRASRGFARRVPMLALIALRWLVSTSVMPLFVGAGTGLAARRVLRPCTGRWPRQAAWAALGAWGVHVVLVAGGLVRDGATLDYGAVLLAAVAASWLAA